MNRDQLLDLGRLYQKQENDIPRAKKWSKKRGYCSRDLIYKEFGDWPSFLIELGINNSALHLREISKDEVEKRLVNLNQKLGRLPIKKDIKGVVGTSSIIKYYGSFNKMIQEVFKKIPTTKTPHNKYNKQELLDLLWGWVADNGTLPSTKTKEFMAVNQAIKREFGSWPLFIEEAGYEPCINDGYGNRTYGLDGCYYRSFSEAYFADRYLFSQYDYENETSYPEPYNRKKYDWYIPELKIYIELDGGIRPHVIEEKKKINKEFNRKLLVIPKDEIYNKTCLEDFYCFIN